MKKIKTQKGITLIALIITIVVLLILAVVAIRAVQGDGILSYAKNARDDYQRASDEENQVLQNLTDYIKEETDSSSKIIWTKTSEGELAVGSTVKTSTNEEFYVIGFDGDNVKLLAKNNLKVDGSAQDTTGEKNPCVFSAAGGFTDGENLNNNSTVKADTTSAVYKAMKYGETLGVTTGRLMTIEELKPLGYDESEGSTSLCNTNGYNWINTTSYWLATAFDSMWVRLLNGSAESVGFNMPDQVVVRSSPSCRNLKV